MQHILINHSYVLNCSLLCYFGLFLASLHPHVQTLLSWKGNTQSGHFRLVTFKEEFFMGFSLGLKQNPYLIIKYNFALFSAYVFHPMKGSPILGLESGILWLFDQAMSLQLVMFSCPNKSILFLKIHESLLSFFFNIKHRTWSHGLCQLIFRWALTTAMQKGLKKYLLNGRKCYFWEFLFFKGSKWRSWKQLIISKLQDE